ncbi:tyrosine phosphatase-like protein [Coniochaeta sp. 2T2.1]|nr:tyrosine phosphatase-like protein [Coniochaeta sp. 2T2.1]
MVSYLRKSYLIAYNAASAVAWATVLGRVIAVLLLRGPSLVPVAVDTFVRNTQTFAALEIFHSLFGVVNAPFMTTFFQVWSRLAIVWGITYPFPEVTTSPFYTSMLAAWATTEVIRYTLFALKESGFPIPYWLHWLRYSAFTVLYPVGITSELVMMYLAYSGPAGYRAEWAPWVIAAYSTTYIPCAPILFSHMVSQRKKQLGGRKANGHANGKAKKAQ